MAHSHTNLVYHIVFATKYRYPWLTNECENVVLDAIKGVCLAMGVHILAIGCGCDHVHIAIDTPQTMALSDIVKRIKGESSYIVRRFAPEYCSFGWQAGYYASTVNPVRMGSLLRYIESQRDRH
jgi:putative transposase